MTSSNTPAQITARNNAKQFGSYGFNNAFYNGGVANGPGGKSIAAIGSVVTTVLVGDAFDLGDNADIYSKDVDNQFLYLPNNKPRVIQSNYGSPGNYALTERHLETTNVLFCDGHVKALKLDALVATNAAGVQKFFSIEDD